MSLWSESLFGCVGPIVAMLPSSSSSSVTTSRLFSSRQTVDLKRLDCMVDDCKFVEPGQFGNNKQSFFKHADLHLSGCLEGKIPERFFSLFKRKICKACGAGSITSGSTTGIHKKCPAPSATKAPDCPPTPVPLDIPPSSAPVPPVPFDSVPLPSLDEIFSLYTPTIRFIPKTLQSDFAYLLNSTLSDALFHDSIHHWTIFLMLPKCLLSKPDPESCPSISKLLSSRILAWKNAEYTSLWSSVSPAPPPTPRNPLLAAKSLAALGQYGKAVTALVPSTRSPVDSKTFAALQAKHYSAPPVETKLVESQQLSVVHSFPSGSSPGPMGLRAEHLKCCIKSPLQTEFLETLTKFVDALIAGKVNLALSPFLAGAHLSALDKKQGGIRPLACGNTLRRLVSKCLCFVSKEKIRKVLAPHQVGVSVPGGAEVITHEAKNIRELLLSSDNYKDHGYLKIDFENAFNRLSRQAIYEELTKEFQELLPYFNWCYANHTSLYFGKFKVSSEVGVQQGDPVGPFFFSLVLRKLINRIQDKFPCLNLNRWYLDDGNLAGDFKSLSQVLELIDIEGPPLGLFLNRSKCQVYGFRSQPPPELFPGLEIGTTSNFDTLGAPIGDTDHCRNFVELKLQKVYEVFDLLEKIDHTQIAFTLLRSCCSFGKIVFFLRTIPSSMITSTCIEFDKRVLTCFEKILSLSLDDSSINQVSLPLSKGGIGLRSARAHAAACYIASTWSAKNYSSLDLNIEEKCIDDFNSRVSVPIDSNSKPLRQKELSSKIDEVFLEKLMSSTSRYTKARMKSILGPSASSWLSVIPSPKMSFSNRQFQIAMKLHLGCPVYPETSKCKCNAPLDRYGLHSLTCKSKGDIIARHNAVRNVIYNYCKAAGLTAKLEKANILGDHTDKRRPADVFIYNFSLNSDHCLDIAITSPLQQKYINSASNTEGYAASDYYKLKRSKYAEAVEAENKVFQPIILETFGRIAEESLSCLTRIANIKADRCSTSRSDAIHELFQQISVALQIRNANMVLKRDSFLV